jgi:Polysaccharide lyase
MSTSRSNTNSALRSALLALAMLAMLLIPFAATAQSSPLRLHLLRSGHEASAEELRLEVSGARHARGVKLYLDGHLRGSDRAWPWSFGRSGQFALRSGRHTISVAARYAATTKTAEKTVHVAADRTRRRNGHRSESGSSGNERTHRDSPEVSPATPVSKPPAKSPRPAPEPPAPEPEATQPSASWTSGNFETGNLSQWEVAQEVAPDRITVTHSPVRQGSYAARFEVRPGDNIGDTPTRAELAQDLHQQEGEDRYYRWFTYFPETFPTNYPDSFITFTQWRAKDESAAYSSFMVWGEDIELRREYTRWSTHLTKNVWHEFVYHVKWSPDPNVGFIELWYDGSLALSRTYCKTMAGTPGHAVGNYVKEGLYKSDEVPGAVLYQDGFTVGSSYAEVTSAS